MGIALVTGASAGIGLELTKLFAKDGHDLILVARRKDRLEELAKELKVKTWIFDIDLSTPEGPQHLFKNVQEHDLHIEFLVNNAGFGSGGVFSELPIERELQMIDLNIRSLVELTRLFLPGMLERKKGKVLNVGSMAGFQPGPFMTTYYASKAFVNSFSEALHDELLGTGVSCTVLAPGPTSTEFAKVSGRKKAPLFEFLPQASAKSVACAGYSAMMKGRALAIPGLSNKLLLQTQRLAPRMFLRKIAGQLNHG